MKRLCTKPNFQKDKGYAWVIGVASFLAHFTHFGMSYGIAGNLTIAHQQFFNINLQKGSLPGAVYFGCLLMLGPLASVMIKKFGCRVTQITGGTCILLGFALSILSRHLWHAVALYSVLAGLGASFCFNANSAILTLHFERFKYIAFSLSMLGAYLGILTWPLLSQYLLSKFGYSYAMGIISTFTLINIIAGILFVQPETEIVFIEKKDFSTPDEMKPSEESLETGADNPAVEISEEDVKVEKEVSKSEEKREHVQDTNLKQEFKELLILPKVWLVLISGMFWAVVDVGFFVLINDYIVYNADNVNEYEAAFGITLLGIGGVVACFSTVVTGALKFNRFLLYFCSIGLTGILTVITAFTGNKTTYNILMPLWGLTNGVATASHVGFVSDLCTEKQFPVLFGMKCFLKGVGGTLLVPLGAYIAQTAGERYGIIFLGCCGNMSALVILPIVVNSVRGNSNNNI